MVAELVPLDVYVSSRMRKKFDEQKSFNAFVERKIKQQKEYDEQIKNKMDMLQADIETIVDSLYIMRNTVDRLCLALAEKEME